MESKIKVCAAVLLAVILVGLGVYFVTPHRIAVPDGEEIYVSYVEPTLEVYDMDSTAKMETTEYHFSPGDEGYDELVTALESVTYRNCFKTLTGSTEISGIGYVIYVWAGEECYGFYDNGYVAVYSDGRILHRMAKKDVEKILQFCLQ